MNLAFLLRLNNSGYVKPAQAAVKETQALTGAAKEMGAAVASAATQAAAPMGTLRQQIKAVIQESLTLQRSSAGGLPTKGLESWTSAAESARSAALSAFGPVALLYGAMRVTNFGLRAASQMEDLQASFTTLLGGAGEAKYRLEELAKFASSTPFELPEVARASRVLETLTQGALATGSGLRMVGDVAAVTQQPIEELAMWIGRLYDGLQSGRSVGEATMRLQELGVMSGQVRSKIEDMQAAGHRGEAVWQVAAASFGKFSGEMERRSKTLSGSMSNLSDSLSGLARAAYEPNLPGLAAGANVASKSFDTLAEKMTSTRKNWLLLQALFLSPTAIYALAKDGGNGVKPVAPKAPIPPAPVIPMGQALEETFGPLDRLAEAKREMKAAFSELRNINEDRVLHDPFSSDEKRRKALQSRARRLFDESGVTYSKAPGASPAFDVDDGVKRLAAELKLLEVKNKEGELSERNVRRIQTILPLYKQLVGVHEQMNALKAKAIDAALHDFFGPLDKIDPAMGGKTPQNPKSEPKTKPGKKVARTDLIQAADSVSSRPDTSDRLSRIGGLSSAISVRIGHITPGGPANDYARRTANATEALLHAVGGKGFIRDAGRINPSTWSYS